MKISVNVEDAMQRLFNSVIVKKNYDVIIPCDIVSGDTKISEIQLVETEPGKFELLIQTTRFYHRSYYYGKKELRRHITMLYEDASCFLNSKKKRSTKRYDDKIKK